MKPHCDTESAERKLKPFSCSPFGQLRVLFPREEPRIKRTKSQSKEYFAYRGKDTQTHTHTHPFIMDLLNRDPASLGLSSYMNDSVLVVNGTQKSQPSGSDSDFDQAKPYMVGLNSAIVVAGLIANILLIVAIRLSPRLKCPIFQLQFALAIVDIVIVLSFGLPSISWFVMGDRWAFGAEGCKVLLFLQYWASHVTMCLLVVCCGERFYAVCRPHSALWMTTRKMSGIIAGICLVNAGILAPLLIMTKPQEIYYTEDGTTSMSCRFDMPEHTKDVYLTVLGGLLYGLTTVICVVFLLCTICKAMDMDLEKAFIKDDFKNHILRTIAVTTGITVLFWLPYRYIYFNSLHNRSGHPLAGAIQELSNLFILLSGSTKGFIYVLMSSQFKKAVFRAIKCCRSDNFDFESTHGYKMNDRMFMTELETLNGKN